MEQILQAYYQNNGKKLHDIIDRILRKFGGISNKDIDDFYSVGNEVLAEIIKNKKYDASKGSFDGYLYKALRFAMLDEITKRNVDKRKSDRLSLSLDTPISEATSSTIGDFLCSNFDIFEEISEQDVSFMSHHVQDFFNSLSVLQKHIISLKIQGYSMNEIMNRLNLTQNEYNHQISSIKSYEHSKFLHRETCDKKHEGGIDLISTASSITTTSEKTKDTHFSVDAMRKKLKRHQLRDDHPLQRASSIWSQSYKSELISDILQGKALTQIIISEEIRDGVVMYWLIDGKQRCTNIDEFCNNGFSISKTVQRYIISYQTQKRDTNGELMFNEEGFPIPEQKEFDIRNKKFSQLPEELQDKILEYPIPTMLNLNCTKKEIAYDIARFNRCRTMTKAQNGWLSMDEGYAECVDKILKMEFFQSGFHGTRYTEANFKAGALRRMIIESIMAIHFLDDFTGDFHKNCKFISEEGNDTLFFDFYDLIDRLEKIANNETAQIFNARDSYVWFALFYSCSEYGITDTDFLKFVEEVNRTLHNKTYFDITYDDIMKNTKKDGTVVKQKVKILKAMLFDYFGLNADESVVSLKCSESWQNAYEEFRKHDLMQNVICSKEDGLYFFGRTMLLLRDNTTDIGYKAIQDFFSIVEPELDMINDLLFYMDMFNEWSLRVKKQYNLKITQIPILLYATKKIINDEIVLEDQKIVNLVQEWLISDMVCVTMEQVTKNIKKIMNDLKGVCEFK